MIGGDAAKLGQRLSLRMSRELKRTVQRCMGKMHGKYNADSSVNYLNFGEKIKVAARRGRGDTTP